MAKFDNADSYADSVVGPASTELARLERERIAAIDVKLDESRRRQALEDAERIAQADTAIRRLRAAAELERLTSRNLYTVIKDDTVAAIFAARSGLALAYRDAEITRAPGTTYEQMALTFVTDMTNELKANIDKQKDRKGGRETL